MLAKVNINPGTVLSLYPTSQWTYSIVVDGNEFYSRSSFSSAPEAKQAMRSMVAELTEPENEEIVEF